MPKYIYLIKFTKEKTKQNQKNKKEKKRSCKDPRPRRRIWKHSVEFKMKINKYELHYYG